MLSHTEFLKTLPEVVFPQLPESLQGMKARQPFRWIVQFYYSEPRLHYEVSRVRNRGWELGFHCEARDKALNRALLYGFRRHLFEIKDALGEQIEAEMWDRGWTKIYEVYPEEALTAAYQAQLGARLAQFIVCLHPIYAALRNDLMRVAR
jgi:hypothetical protein